MNDKKRAEIRISAWLIIILAVLILMTCSRIEDTQGAEPYPGPVSAVSLPYVQRNTTILYWPPDPGATPAYQFPQPPTPAPYPGPCDYIPNPCEGEPEK